MNKVRLEKISVQDFREKVKLHGEWLENQEQGERAVFKDIDFTHIQFNDLNLEWAFFENCYFPHVPFGNCNFRKAEFYRIESSGFFSSYSDFTKAKFWNVKADEMSFYRCDLTKTRFVDIDFKKVDFSWSRLDGTKFDYYEFGEIEAEGTKFVDVQGFAVLGVQWSDGYNNKTLYYIPKYDLVSAGYVGYGYSCTMAEFEEELEDYEEEGTLSVSYRHYEKDKETLTRAVQYLKEEAKRIAL